MVLAWIGLAFVVYTAFRLFTFAQIYFFHVSILPKYAVPNAYALVTGASDGIGRGLAKELAARGFNLVLHGRNQAKLDQVKADIAARFPDRKVRTVIADASDSATLRQSVSNIAETLRNSLHGPLTLLLNNCGGTQPLHRQFLTLREMTFEEIDGVIDLNARFHAQLTRALLPLLLGEEGAGAGRTGRPGIIVYTGSAVSSQPGPWLTTYSASKSFGGNLMIALGRELLETNPHLETLHVLVGQVTDTSFFKAKPTIFAPDSTTMAAAILDRVGCGRLSVAGYWAHAVQLFMLDAMPESLQTKVIAHFLKLDPTISESLGAGLKSKAQ